MSQTTTHSDHPTFYAVRAAILDAHPRASKAREYKLSYAAALIEGRPVKINRSYNNLVAHLISVRHILKTHGVLTQCAITPTHVICKNMFA